MSGRRLSGVHVAALGAVMLAALVAQIAIAGNRPASGHGPITLSKAELKRLIDQRIEDRVATIAKKKKVKRGPAGPQGPQGLQGTQGLQGIKGIQGIQGTPGPTFGAVQNGTNPPTTPDGFFNTTQTTVTTPAPGRLLVMFGGSSYVEIACSAGTGRLALYVDGVGVPSTLRDGVGSPGGPVQSVFGVTASALPAGDHTIEVGADCLSGSLTSTGIGEYSFGAVLLGA